MEHKTEEKERGKRSSRQQMRWPFRHRLLAMVLTMTVLFSSSGLITVTARADGEEEEPTGEVVESYVDTSNGDTTTEGTTTDGTTTEDTTPGDTTAGDDTLTGDDTTPSDDTISGDTGTVQDPNGGDGTEGGSDSTDVTLDDGEGIDALDAEGSVQSNNYTDSDGNYDISSLITSASMEVYVNGNWYTVDELNANGITVPKGATVKVSLTWNKITGIEAGQKLVYQIPAEMMTDVVEEEPFMFNDDRGTFAGYMSLTSDGLFTVEIDSTYFKKWSTNQGTSTLELDYLTLEFSAAFSSERGEHSGNGDNEFNFGGSSDGTTDDLTFDVPFEYKNENSPVYVKKESSFDAAKKVITYTVTVSTPSTNTLTSENVILTDTFESTKYLENTNTYGVYGNVKATLYTNTKDGTVLANGTDITSFKTKSGNGVLTIGDMEPDSVVVLTYTVDVKSDYFTGSSNSSIHNSALATYNDITQSIGENCAERYEECQGAVSITKSAGNMVTDSDGRSYIPYTVKVTASRGPVSNITVQDIITNRRDAIASIENYVVTTGNCAPTCLDTTATDKQAIDLLWENINLNADETATLTYKAYLDPSAWIKESGSSSSTINYGLDLGNKASVYVKNSNGDLELYGYTDTSKHIVKLWVSKTGVKNDSDGSVSYTLQINGDPMCGDITTIFDSLSGGSKDKAKITYPLTLKVYASSSSKTPLYTESLDAATVGGTNNGWSLDLTKYDGGKLYGPYYYVVTYKVTDTGSLNKVENGAGIYRGSGDNATHYLEGTSVEVKSISAYKRLTELDYVNNYCTWTSTMETDIEAGSVYYDWVDSDNVADFGIWWFTLENMNAVEVYQGDTLIYSQAKNIDTYGITVEPYDPTVADQSETLTPVTVLYYKYDDTFTTATKDPTKFGKVGYYGFMLKFGQEITASKDNPVTIKYNLTICKENIYWRNRDVEGDANVAAGTRRTSYPVSFKNSYRWELSSGLTKQEKDGNDRTITRVYGAEDVIKGSKYDATTGTITWKIYVNRQGDMLGNATVIDTLPAGLVYDGVTLSYTLSNDDKEYVGDKFDTNTNNAKTKYGNIKKDSAGKDCVTTTELATGETQITIELENLMGYSFNTYEINEDGTYTLKSTTTNKEGDTTGRESSWDRDGIIVLTITSHLSNESKMAAADQDLYFKNNVTVYNDTMAYGYRTASKTQMVEATGANLTKTMSQYNGGTTLTFTMNINPSAYDLVQNSDTLEIMDVMSSKMSLATRKSNYFVVTDASGNTLTAADSEEIGANEYYLTEVDSEDGTAYKIIVPDSKKLTITYKVMVDAAIGETVQISNKAYFNYKGMEGGSDAATTEKEIVITKAQGSTGASASPSFQIYKQDQWGKPLAGVEFSLYAVQMSGGKAVYEGNEVALSSSPVAVKTTGADGLVEFTGLDDSKVYCFYETDVPEGYGMSAERTYFYFTYMENLGIPSATGIDYNEKVFTVTNAFYAASLTIPVLKTINGEEQTNSNVFTFTLTKDSTSGTVYSDETCTTTVDSIEASVTGSGTTSFNTIYFRQAGIYKFTLKENDLTAIAAAEGFTKSDVVYNIEVKVVNSKTKGLSVESAAYTWTDAKGDHTGYLLLRGVPAFDNTLSLESVTVTLDATKVIAGDKRPINISEGEFTFNVVEDGEVIATGKTKAGDQEVSTIEFTGITYDQTKLGRHVLTIYEVEGSDPTITYSTTKFFATVMVEPVEGQAKLQATVTYSTRNKTDLDENGQPVFTNTYKQIVPATGIRMDTIPFVIMLALAATFGGLMIIRKRKRLQ